MIIYDSDGTTELYNGYGAGGDLTGITASSTGDTIFVAVTSDGSVQACTADPWDWDVECLSCTPATGATTSIVSDCLATGNFSIQVDFTASNDATQVTDGLGYHYSCKWQTCFYQ